MNKYHNLLQSIVTVGRNQQNKKGGIKYLINEKISMDKGELVELFSIHKVAKKKLKAELELYMTGKTETEEYRAVGIDWWDYCSPRLINSYPTYFKKLPALIAKINKEKRSSKNYVLFIGETGIETNQLPCLSLIQFQICEGKLHITVFQRSADSSIGLPSDIYQMQIISEMIDIELVDITFFIGNAHIYENNIEATEQLLKGKDYKYTLNV